MPVRFDAHVHHTGHPDLAGRKELAAHWVISQYLRWPLRASNPEAEVYLANFARTQIDALSGKAGVLSDMVSAVLLAVENHAAISYPDLSLSTQISLAQEQIDCNQCAHAGNGKVCQGGFGDWPLLKIGAQCLEPIYKIFHLVIDAAQRAYAPILKSGSQNLRLKLVITRTGGDCVSGETVFVDDCKLARSAEIRLGLPVDAFSSVHICHAIYVLMHEVFVHGTEAWLHEKRQASNQDCSLREGFIDRAAVHVLARYLRDVANPSDFSGLVEPLILVLEAAHRSRLDAAPVGVSAARAALVASVAANRERGFVWFERLNGRGKGDSAARLAMCLNILGLSSDDKGACTAFLERATHDFADAARAAAQGDGGFLTSPHAETLIKLMEAADDHDSVTIRDIIAPRLEQLDF